MRLHTAAVLTENSISELELSSGGGIIREIDTVPVEPLLLWLLLQTYRDYHNIHRPDATAAEKG